MAFTKEQLDILREWEFILKNICDFVQVGRVNGLVFKVYTNEQGGHHTPHIHVSSGEASLSIAIEDGELLARSGKISPPQIKQAQKWVSDNRELVSEKWNEFSNGITIDVA